MAINVKTNLPMFESDRVKSNRPVFEDYKVRRSRKQAQKVTQSIVSAIGSGIQRTVASTQNLLIIGGGVVEGIRLGFSQGFLEQKNKPAFTAIRIQRKKPTGIVGGISGITQGRFARSKRQGARWGVFFTQTKDFLNRPPQEMIPVRLGKARDAWVMGKMREQVNKRARQAQKKLKKAQRSMQSQMLSYARKQQRGRVLYRLGLIAGVVLVLLYAPWPGSETRRRLVELWRNITRQAASEREHSVAR